MLYKHDTLMLDWDCLISSNWLTEYVHRVAIPILKSYGLTVVWVKYRLSRGKGFHLYVKVEPSVSDLLLLKLQLFLGDDRERFSISRARLRAGVNWNRLFEEPDRQLRTIYENPNLHSHHT
jgi:hypothetical protein